MTPDKIREFFVAKAPEALSRLPAEIPTLPAPYQQTNLHFAVRLFLEAQDILRRGDSQINSFDFSLDDVNAIFLGYLKVRRAFDQGAFGEDVIGVVGDLPTSVRAIATYHAQKVRCCEEASQETKDLYDDECNKYAKALQQKDFTALLAFHPHLTSLIYDNGETDVPENRGKTCSIVRPRMKDRLRRTWDSSDQRGLPTALMFGLPPAIRELDHKLSVLGANKRRNESVLEGIQRFAEQLENCFRPQQLTPEKRSAKVIELFV